MANVNAPDTAYFESFAKEIEGKFERIKHLISHGPSKGEYHEEVLRSIIRNFLTKRFSVKRGFIFKNQEEVSKQIDIIIIDENHPAAYIFQEGNFAIVMPEAVVGIVEVKTRFSAKEFDQAIENIAQAKSLYKFPTNLMAIIFAFGSTVPTDNILNRWFQREMAKKYSEKRILGPDGILLFNDGSFLTRHNEVGKMRSDGDYYHKIYRLLNGDPVNDVGWHLSIMLAMLVSSCELSDFNRTHQFTGSRAERLVQAEGSMRSHNRFALGIGMSTLD